MRAMLLLALVACESNTSPPPSPPEKLVVEKTTNEPIPLAVAVVFNGQEIWVGNETVETDEAATYRGWLQAMADAFTKSEPAKVLPAGSTSVVIAYSTGAKIIKPMGPIDELVPAVFKTQRDYRGTIGTDLIQGMELALGILESAKQPRRAMIVIGDGNDTNNETAVAELAKMKHRAIAANTRVYALVMKSPISIEGDVMTREPFQVRIVSTGAQLATELAAIWQQALER